VFARVFHDGPDFEISESLVVVIPESGRTIALQELPGDDHAAIRVLPNQSECNQHVAILKSDRTERVVNLFSLPEGVDSALADRE
jgi:hypothetical protein